MVGLMAYGKDTDRLDGGGDDSETMVFRESSTKELRDPPVFSTKDAWAVLALEADALSSGPVARQSVSETKDVRAGRGER